jgi:hemoglobin/transferrin/lactoferrin receptor protein
MRYLNAFFFIFCFYFVNSQEVRVLDLRTALPLEGVIISSARAAVMTDSQGIASLERFSDRDMLHFRHPSYENRKLSKQTISSKGFMVHLAEQPLDIGEVVISVSRRLENKSEVPNKIIQTGAEDITLTQPQNTAHHLAVTGEVYIQESQQGGGSPMVRGFSANRLLLVVDGVRMNNAIFRSGNLHNVVSIDPNMVQSTEILLGPGSVIYGSDAMGGVLHFNTFRPRLSTSDTGFSDHFFRSSYASGNNSRSFHGRLGYGKQRWGAVLAGTYADFGNLVMGTNGPAEYLRLQYVLPDRFDGRDSVAVNRNQRKQMFTAYHQYNLMGRMRILPFQGMDINLGIHYSGTGDVPRYDRLIVYRGNSLRYGDWFYGPQKWLLASAQADWLSRNLLFDRISLIAGYQYFRESRHDRNLNSPVLFHRSESLDVYSLSLDFTREYTSDLMIMYGYEMTANRIDSEGLSENLLSSEISGAGSRYPDGSVCNTNALYLSGKYIAGDGIILNGGVRWSVTRMEGKFDSRYYQFPFQQFNMVNRAVNGNIGIVWEPSPAWQFNLMASSAFRSPNIDDVSKVFDSEPGNLIVPNPDLKPEYAYNLEGRMIRRFSEKHLIEVTAFRTWLIDAMVRRPATFNGQDSLLYNGVLSRIESLVNADHAEILGVSSQLDFQLLSGLRAKGSLTYLKGRDSDGNPLRHVPPVFGNIRVGHTGKKLTTELNIQANGKISYHRLAPEEREKPYLYIPDRNGNPYSPAWWTLNLASAWSVAKQFTVSAGLNNILDKRYRTYSSGIAAPGRSISLSLSFKP